ncbi:LAG1-domain-containing protein [Ascoidea rubescens DSM 1968]|uniref:LAG1-domain-containing protein n=1 Tax=Ascoidea rubescens DSM 1968 TaxID=1344418 RepID=A0A1D2VDX5_9ASCO|nr:LAG1-domain-containing protein [Ascoidea rubescens DSM 1968]ODV59908.1 LAG1-domain-containing protein [Ascoidea rubescens DSM 1968]
MSLELSTSVSNHIDEHELTNRNNINNMNSNSHNIHPHNIHPHNIHSHNNNHNDNHNNNNNNNNNDSIDDTYNDESVISNTSSSTDLSSSNNTSDNIDYEKLQYLIKSQDTFRNLNLNPNFFNYNNHLKKEKPVFINKIDKYQLIISLSLICSLILINFLIPSLHQYSKNFLHLQYLHPNPASSSSSSSPSSLNSKYFYGIGINDSYFVIFWIINLTLIRIIIMDIILKPIAYYYFKIHKDKNLQRFSEQGWSLFYYSISFSSGFYLYYNSDYFNKLDNLYNSWPNDKISFLNKIYYLVNVSNWLQQIFVLNIEEKRKDYLQMFSHHIITVLLIIGSYYYYFMEIGNVILVLMDIVDVILSLAKMQKYCGFNKICDVTFIIFLISWIILRHGFYNVLTYHIFHNYHRLMKDTECTFDSDNNSTNDVDLPRCWTDNIVRSFVALLVGLQILTCIWMYFILRVAYKVIKGKGAEDVRSDTETEDDGKHQHQHQHQHKHKPQHQPRDNEGIENINKN